MNETVLLELIDPEKGTYKWYRLSVTTEHENSLFGFYQVTIERGRIGQEGETIKRSFGAEDEAKDFFSRRVREKLASGYSRVEELSPLISPDCVLCRLVQRISEEPRVIYEFPKSIFLLNRDQTYLGRSILVIKKHIPDFFRLAPSELLESLKEIRLAETALRRAFFPVLMNYLFMGNTAGHVHLHLVPRYSSDPNFGNSPFLETKRTLEPQLSEGEYRDLVEKIREHLP